MKRRTSFRLLLLTGCLLLAVVALTLRSRWPRLHTTARGQDNAVERADGFGPYSIMVLKGLDANL